MLSSVLGLVMLGGTVPFHAPSYPLGGPKLSIGQETAPPKDAPQWAISTGRTLVWEGKPYIPFGLRIPDSTTAIRAAADAGIKDVLVEISADFNRLSDTIQSLEEAGMRYVLAINSLAPDTKGYAVEPESYRVQDLTGPTRLRASIPGSDEALVLMVNQRSSTVVQQRVAKLTQGELDINVDAGAIAEHVALLYPLVQDIRTPDAWEELDKYRDRLYSALARVRDHKGLRGVIDPLGVLPKFPSAEPNFVPTSPRFQLELQAALKKKYGTDKRAEMAWAINASDVQGLDHLARLIPLWTARRGLGQLFDPVTGELYRVDRSQSAAWSDIREVMRSALIRRYRNICAHLENSLRVPIMQSWADWNGPYANEANGLAGLSFGMEGASFSDLMEGAGRAASTVTRWRSAGVLMAGEVTLPEDESRLAAMAGAIEDSAQFGVRGWFVRADSPAQMQWVADIAVKIAQLPGLAQGTSRYIPYPESAANPAYTMRLGGDTWWVPSPNEGHRLDLGRATQGYAISGVDGKFYALWSTGAERPVKLRVPEPKSAKIIAADGGTIQFKATKTHLEFKLGPSPVLISGVTESPIPEDAVNETMAEFVVLEKLLPTGMRTAIEEVAYFKQAAASYKSQPQAAFVNMRSLLMRLERLLGPVYWIEAEASRQHNFSDVVTQGGASGSSALSLSARVFPQGGAFRARYPIQPKLEGTQSLWIAAAGDAVSALNVSLLGENYQVGGLGISPYGQGFRWYKVGTMNIPASGVDILLNVPAPFLGNLMVDAMLLAPESVTPNGTTLPWSPPMK